MAEDKQETEKPKSLLSERVRRYREEVQRLVREGIEHPQFESEEPVTIILFIYPQGGPNQDPVFVVRIKQKHL